MRSALVVLGLLVSIVSAHAGKVVASGRPLILVQPGTTYSRKIVTATQELIQNRLGQEGYAFAKVDPVPTTDKKTGIVALTFFVDPGNRVYVRNITFSGVKRINDEVLRRLEQELDVAEIRYAAVNA